MKRALAIMLSAIALAAMGDDIPIGGGGLVVEPGPGDVPIFTGGGITDAPATNGPYARQSNAWVDVSGLYAPSGSVGGVSGDTNLWNAAITNGGVVINGVPIGNGSNVTIAASGGGDVTNSALWLSNSVGQVFGIFIDTNNCINFITP